MSRRQRPSISLSTLRGGVPRAAWAALRADCDALVVTGGDLDMCVLTTVLGAVDLGYRTVLVTDVVCSASDSAHDAMLELFGKRYRRHVETATTQEVCGAWDRGR